MTRSFKYRSGPAALRSLSEGTAYFAFPPELNDCLEAKFDLVCASQFINVVVEAFSEIACQREMDQYSVDQSGLEEFEHRYIKECKRFQKASQRVGIFSSATRPDNQAMWAYYCENSAGVCFEREWSDELLEEHQLWLTPVHYRMEERIHNRAHDFRTLLLQLTAQHPDWTVAQIKEFSLTEAFCKRWGIESMARAVSQKHTVWQHESELRVLAPLSGAKRIIRDTLKRVFFARTDFVEWGPIMKQLHAQYPDVEIAQIAFDHRKPYVREQEYEFRLVPL